MPRPKPPRWPYGHIAPGVHAHANGQWAKKVGGRREYLGVWADTDEALRNYRRLIEELSQPEPERRQSDPTVKYAIDAWLTRQKQRMTASELSPRTFGDYRNVGTWLGRTLGPQKRVSDLLPRDWSAARAKLSETAKSPNSVEKFIVCSRSCFKWCHESGLIDAPPRYGPDWRSPGKDAKRKHRAKRRHESSKLISPVDLRRLIRKARPNIRAMIYLGINGGFGASDCSQLDVRDVKGSFIDFPRPKTGIDRRIPLWPETATALRKVIGHRTSGPVFKTRLGHEFVRSKLLEDGKVVNTDAVGWSFRTLAAGLEIDATFYGLRHTFRTVADELADSRAIDRVMGHVTPGISDDYVERVSDERLRAVTDHVRAWFKRSSQPAAKPRGAGAGRARKSSG